MKKNLYPVIGHIFLIPSAQIHCKRMRREDDLSNEIFAELVSSIQEYGLLEPLQVSMTRPEEYDIISGERRYFACLSAGMTEIPCILLDAGENAADALRLIKRQQELPTHYLEEAKAIQALGLSIPCAARLLNKSLSYISDKLKLLSLSDSVLERIIAEQIPEVIALALTGIDEEKRDSILNFCKERRLTADTIKEMSQSEQQGIRQARIVIFKDINVFTNTVERAVAAMLQAGVNADCTKSETENTIEYHVTIQKSASSSSPRFNTG